MQYYYYAYLLSPHEAPNERQLIPVLSCPRPRPCLNQHHKHEFYGGTKSMIPMEHLKIRVQACKCQRGREDATCHLRWFNSDIFTFIIKERQLCSPEMCTNICQVPNTSYQVRGHPNIISTSHIKCDLFKSVTGEYSIKRRENTTEPYDARQVLATNFKSKVGVLNPFAYPLMESNLDFDSNYMVKNSAKVSVTMETTDGLTFIQTKGAPCELVLSRGEGFLYTGTRLYFDNNFENIKPFVKQIAAFSDSVQIPNYQLEYDAITIFMASTTESVSILCNRIEERDLCRNFEPSDGIKSEIVNRAAQLGTIFSTHKNKTFASQCTVTSELVDLHSSTTEPIQKDEKSYSLVKTRVPHNYIIRLRGKFDAIKPDEISLAHNDLIGLYTAEPIRGNLTLFKGKLIVNDTDKYLVESDQVSSNLRTEGAESLSDPLVQLVNRLKSTLIGGATATFVIGMILIVIKFWPVLKTILKCCKPVVGKSELKAKGKQTAV